VADDVIVSGPLFDGRADAALRRGIEAARDHVAAVGAAYVHTTFAGSIRVETGRFQESVTVVKDSKTFSTRGGSRVYTMPVVVDRSTETLVTTELATYGPWLEGTGSRNQTTRFKGYHGYRKAAQELDRVAAPLAAEALDPYVREMS
jgi:hypothetical protein